MVPDISKQNLDAFNNADERRLREDVTSLVKEHNADLLEGLPDEEVDDMVARGIKRARSFGMRVQRSIAAFVNLKLAIAPGFYRHPDINEILTDARIGPDARVEVLPSAVDDAAWAEAELLDEEDDW